MSKETKLIVTISDANMYYEISVVMENPKVQAMDIAKNGFFTEDKNPIYFPGSKIENILIKYEE